MAGDTDDLVVLAAESGYGFIARMGELYSKNKAGKAVLSARGNINAIAPCPIDNPDKDLIACVTTAGYLLVFKAKELPELARGKGLKMMQIPAAKLKNKEEHMSAIVALAADDHLMVVAGNRHVTLKGKDLARYRGGRARRGLKLPRGFQKVDAIIALEA